MKKIFTNGKIGSSESLKVRTGLADVSKRGKLEAGEGFKWFPPGNGGHANHNLIRPWVAREKIKKLN